MAIYKNAHFTATGANLSSFVRSLTFTEGGEPQDDTAMGDDTRSNAGGLKTWALEVEMNQSFATNGPDATFRGKNMTTMAIVFRPDATGVSTTNPERTGTGLIAEYTPNTGNVGDQMICRVSILAAGELAIATTT